MKHPVQMFAFATYRQAYKFQREMAERGCPSNVAPMNDGMFAVMVKGRPAPAKKPTEETP